MPQIFIEDVSVGMALPMLTKGPMSSSHIMRWSSAIENWHRIHYDRDYAVNHDKLPDIMVNGSWKQHVLLQLLTDWAGDTGWVWRSSFQFRGMNVPGETLSAWGEVTALTPAGDYALVELTIGLRNDAGVESTPGTATVVLPKRNGPAVPYPFDPAVLGTSVTEAR